MSWFYYTIDRAIEQVFFLFLCNSSPTCRGEFLLYYVKITLISSFVNMSVRVIFAAILVFHFSLQIEALPFFLSCRMDWNACGGDDFGALAQILTDLVGSGSDILFVF